MRPVIFFRTLLTTLSSLTLATSASAEGAWALWEENGGPGGWRRIEVLDTKSACQAAALHEASSRYSREVWEIHHRRVAPGEVELHGDRWLVNIPVEFGEVWTISYECFPDTVDPRGPKGK